MKALNLVDRFIVGLESIWLSICAVSFAAIMLIIFFDVALRYTFNAPLDWSYPMITMYLMVASFFLALSSNQRDNYNIRVDLLSRILSKRARMALELLAYVLAMIVMAGIFYQGCMRFWRNFEAGDVTPSVIPWPVWPTSLLVLIGVGLLLLRLVFGVFSLSTALAIGSSEAVGIGNEPSIEGAD